MVLLIVFVGRVFLIFVVVYVVEMTFWNRNFVNLVYVGKKHGIHVNGGTNIHRNKQQGGRNAMNHFEMKSATNEFVS